MLSQAAFNAFLKTLEEPPAHAIFILATTEKHKILPTILSRCQTFDFGRISVPDIVRNLRGIATKEGITIDDESLHIIALKADGAMRDALTIFDQTVAFCGTEVAYADVLKNLNVLDYDHCFSLVDSFLAGDYDAALLRFDDILSKGFNALHFVGSLSSHLRDLLVARSGGLRALLDLPESLVARYQEQAQRCSPRFLYEALAATTACESGYKASINPRLHIEFCLLRLCNLCKEMPGQAGHDGAPAQTGHDGAPASTPAAPASTSSLPAQTGNPAPAGTSSLPAQTGNPATSSAPSVISSERSESRNLNTKPQSTEISPLRPSASGRNDSNSASGRNDNDLAPAPKRGRRAPGAMSLNALRTDEAPAASPQPAAQPKEEKPLQQEQIKQQWLELAKAYVSRTRLYTTLTGAKLAFAEEDGITTLTFSVQNTAQMDWIKEKLLRELEGKLCQMLSTTKLKLDIDVIPDDEVKQTSYTSREQAQELMQSNPEVLNLVKDMGLDA